MHTEHTKLGCQGIRQNDVDELKYAISKSNAAIERY